VIGAAVLARRSFRVSPIGLAVTCGLAFTALYVFGVIAFMARSSYDIWGAAFIGPACVILSIPFLAREANRQNDNRLFWLLLGALVLKLVGSLVRYYVAFEVYGGAADATGYHKHGIEISESIRQGIFSGGLDSFTRDEFISYLTGVFYSIVQPTKLGGFLFFSWLGWLGLFLFYRAFVTAVPEGKRGSYARWVFLFPSLLYWPSSTGKDAWMVLAIGVASLGVARVLVRTTFGGIVLAGLGMWMAGIVRIPIAGMIAIALAGAYLLKRPERELRHLAPIAKIAAMLCLVFVAVFFVNKTEEFLKADTLFSSEGVATALEANATRADSGGSSFKPEVVRSPLQLPAATATVLFRPFLFEANNSQAAVSAVEATLLLLITVIRFPSIVHAVRSIRDHPYIAFVILYAGMFIVAFASFPNFGLLARQRVQLLPLFFVLLCIPSKSSSEVRPNAARHGSA
jgi:hypothetical protein